MRNFGEESTTAKCCHLDVRYFIASLASPLEELWPQGGCQERGWGRLGLLTSTWLPQKRARLSEQDLCEERLKSRREVQIFCGKFLVNPGGPTGTITHDEGTESFQVPEVQLVENSDAKKKNSTTLS